MAPRPSSPTTSYRPIRDIRANSLLPSARPRHASRRMASNTGRGAGMDILEAIGRTSLVELGRVVPAGSARVFAKLEWENPTGSMKDRMAAAVIVQAEQ